jgi:uncharacterized membrane protein
MWTALVVAVPWLIISLLMGGFTRDARDEAWHVRASQFGDYVFREKRWLLVFYICSLLLSCAGIGALAFVRPRVWYVFAILLTAIFTIPAVFGILDYHLACVEVRGSTVRYRRILRRKPFFLHDITLCRALQGYIFVHLPRRLVRIPLVFQDSGLLLAILQQYRPAADKSNQTMQLTPSRTESTLHDD